MSIVSALSGVEEDIVHMTSQTRPAKEGQGFLLLFIIWRPACLGYAALVDSDRLRDCTVQGSAAIHALKRKAQQVKFQRQGNMG